MTLDHSSAAPVADPLLRVEHLSKRFGAVLANDDISFEVASGEIHCLLGENGAGKSTLTECIFGLYQADTGRIACAGRELQQGSPEAAIAAGVGMVHQHFVLAQALTVLENIIVGAPGTAWWLQRKSAAGKVEALCGRFGLKLDLAARVCDLSVGEQQWVEILKALYLDARVLMLDEPTAVLTPQESTRLFTILRRLTASGLSVLLITHKLDEVMQCDRVTVLRKGRRVDTVVTASTTREALTRMMVGRDVLLGTRRQPQARGVPQLTVEGLETSGNRGGKALDAVSFTLHAGEILGLAGVAGNGQNELFETLIGVRRASAGRIMLGTENLTTLPAAARIARGIGHIPDDRYGKGLIGEFSIAENLALGQQHTSRFSRWGLLNRPQLTAFARDCMTRFAIKAPSSETPARELSGGNAQKIILAREFAQASRVLLANQPTRGLDVGVIEYVHEQLLAKRRDGFGILLASEELDDLLALCDRIAVMFKGRILAVLETDATSREEIGALMAGSRPAVAA